MGSRPVAMIAAALLALTASTCHNDDDSETSGRTTTTQSAEAEVETSYLAFADMGARLLQAPNPADPEISQRMMGEAMDELVTALGSLQDAGLRYELGPDYSHLVRSVELNGDDAVVAVCVIDDSKQVNVTTGEITAEGATTVDWTVNMHREHGNWLVEEIAETAVREGVTECN